MSRETEESADASVTMPYQGLKQYGPYRILQKLGEGGMGTVYLALDSRLERQVALKVCRGPAKAQALERFQREAKAAASLRHPNLCPVYDCGVENEAFYFTMAYVPGPTLDKLLARRGALPQRAAAILVKKLALAVQAAHDGGVVHRDLKPGNIVLEKHGEPVIIDFGLVRQTEADDARLTKEGAVMGTPAYMSPEQVRGNQAEVGPASDIYALGAILYEALTGKLPFSGTATMVLARVLTAEPRPPRQVREDLNPELERICLEALAKASGDRWDSAREMAAALEDWLRADAAEAATAADEPQPAGRPGVADTMPPTSKMPNGTAPATMYQRPRRPGRRKKQSSSAGAWIMVGFMGLVLLATGITLLVAARSRKPGVPPEAPAENAKPAKPNVEPAPVTEVVKEKPVIANAPARTTRLPEGSRSRPPLDDRPPPQDGRDRFPPPDGRGGFPPPPPLPPPDGPGPYPPPDRRRPDERALPDPPRFPRGERPGFPKGPGGFPKGGMPKQLQPN